MPSVLSLFSPHVLAFPTRNGQSNMRHWWQIPWGSATVMQCLNLRCCLAAAQLFRAGCICLYVSDVIFQLKDLLLKLELGVYWPSLFKTFGVAWGLSVGDMAEAVVLLHPHLVCVLSFSNSSSYTTPNLCYIILTFFYDFLWSHYLVVVCLIMGC